MLFHYSVIGNIIQDDWKDIVLQTEASDLDFYTTDQTKKILGVGVNILRARVNDGSLIRAQVGRII